MGKSKIKQIQRLIAVSDIEDGCRFLARGLRNPISNLQSPTFLKACWGQEKGLGGCPKSLPHNFFTNTSFHFSNNDDEGPPHVISPTSTTFSLHLCYCIDTDYFVSTGDRRKKMLEMGLFSRQRRCS